MTNTIFDRIGKTLWLRFFFRKDPLSQVNKRIADRDCRISEAHKYPHPLPPIRCKDSKQRYGSDFTN